MARITWFRNPKEKMIPKGLADTGGILEWRQSVISWILQDGQDGG